MKNIRLILFSSMLGWMTILAWLHIGGVLERPGLIMHDWLQRTFPAPSSNQVALVLVDQATVDSLANQYIYFPFRRELYANLLNAAKKLGAKAVGFDIIFSKPSERGPKDDLAFASAIENAGFPIAFVSDGDKSQPTEILKKSKGLSWGDTHTVPPPDGIFRRLAESPKSFASALAPGHTHTGWIHFTRPKSIPEVPLFNVLQTETGEELEPEILNGLKSKLSGKIWVVGYSAAGLLDIKPSPIDPNGSGAYLPAHLISEKLQGLTGIHPLETSGYLTLSVGLILIWVGFLLAFNPQHPTSLLFLSLSTSILGPIIISVAVWNAWQTWIDPVALASCLLTSVGIHFTYKVRRDWAERRRFARTIEHSMSPDMLKMIENGEVEVRRYGEKRELCILFADLSGFTTMSEILTPEMLVHLMNEYLDGVVDLIMKRSGYIDKFIGDAVMALWGAPIRSGVDSSKDADAALMAALGFSDVTNFCRDRWKKERNLDLPVFSRVGVHFGEAIVGNIGSHNRFNYTALGDAVNLASRLEGVGKYYNQLVTVSGEVIARASSDVRDRFFCVDEITVKGKAQPTRIFTSKDNLTPEAIATYTQAFDYYRTGQWAKASEGFSHAVKNGIGAAKNLQERCAALNVGVDQHKFRNGVWILDEK